MTQSNNPSAPSGQPANLQLQGGAAIVAPVSAFPGGVPGNALVVLPLNKPNEEFLTQVKNGPVALEVEQMWKLLGFNGPAVQVQDAEGRPIAIGLEDLIAGLEKRNRILNPREREIVAYHEMGHALVALALPGSDAVHKVSIIPRGVGALGYTIQRPTEDRFLMTREELENKIRIILGGRAAEKLIFDHLSTGAADDIVRATDIARSIVARYGMDPRLGSVAYDTERSPFLQPAPGQAYLERRFSEATAREIDLAVRHIIEEAFSATMRILENNQDILERCARELLKVETLEEGRLKELTRDLRREPTPEMIAAQ